MIIEIRGANTGKLIVTPLLDLSEIPNLVLVAPNGDTSVLTSSVFSGSYIERKIKVFIPTSFGFDIRLHNTLPTEHFPTVLQCNSSAVLRQGNPFGEYYLISTLLSARALDLSWTRDVPDGHY